MLNLTLMELPDGSRVHVNQWDVAERLAGGWVVVAQGAL